MTFALATSLLVPVLACVAFLLTLTFFYYCFFHSRSSSSSSSATLTQQQKQSQQQHKQTSADEQQPFASTPALMKLEGGLETLPEGDEEEDDVQFDSRQEEEVEEEIIEIRTPQLRVYIPPERNHGIPTTPVEPKPVISCSRHHIHICPRHGAISSAKHASQHHHHHHHHHQAIATPTTATNPSPAAATSQDSDSEDDDFAINIAASTSNKDLVEKQSYNLASPTEIRSDSSPSSASPKSGNSTLSLSPQSANSTSSPSSASSTSSSTSCTSTTSTNSSTNDYYSTVTSKLTEASRIDKLRSHLLKRSEMELKKIEEHQDHTELVDKLKEYLFIYGIEWNMNMNEKQEKQEEKMNPLKLGNQITELIHSHCDRLKLEFAKQQRSKYQFHQHEMNKHAEGLGGMEFQNRVRVGDDMDMEKEP